MFTKFGRWWKSLNKLVRNFVIWASAGAFVILAFLFIGRPSMCQAISDQWTAHGYQYSGPKDYGAEQRGNFVIEKKKSSYRPKEGSNNEITENFYDVVCGEMKATDLALVYFTYVLVLIGVYQMRSADENVRRAERAYLIAGPLFGAPKQRVEEWERRHRAMAHMFKAPWRLSLQNFGRTAAYTIRVEWGLCHRHQFPKGVLVSDIVESDKYADWRSRHMRKPVTVQDVFTPTDEIPYQYRHIVIHDRDKYVGWIFFGKITYKDVFGEQHFSTFSYKIRKEHSDSIGKSLSDDHT